MDTCPYCGAPGSFRESVDGCCYVCGMVLPDATMSPIDTDSADETPPPVKATAPPPPSSPPDTDERSTDVRAVTLIQPRNLSPEYARRVTAAWKATKSPFQNPRETLNSSSSLTGDPSSLIIGTRSLGNVDDQKRSDYELTDVIGEGNMGTVWSARQASLDREVAVKMPKHSISGATLGAEQFIFEVVVTGQLDHPNIVPIYDLARNEAGQLFYSMKRVEGQSWDNCMHDGRTPEENVEVLMKVCDAIRFAHDRGVIHRDIKPQNIMVGKYGEVSVMDWGIALRLDAVTRTSGITRLSPAGTPAYMAPEMATANASDIGPHTDVYLLGAVLYEIITGDPPHPPPKDSHDRFVVQNACLLIAARNVITPAQQTGELIDIAYKAMATDISNRFQTVDEFQGAIREYFSHSESIALTERGQSHLTHAEESRNGVYEDFAKARFAFGEAVQLWPENERARSGLAQATLQYAGSALKRRDYALGLSLLDPNEPDHAGLYKELSAAKRRSERSRFAAIASACAAVCFLIAGIAVSLFFGRGQYLALKEAEAAHGTASVATAKAKAAEAELASAGEQVQKAKDEVAKNQKERDKLAAEAVAKGDQLKKIETDLNAARTDVERQTRMAQAAQGLADQASYRSELGFAAAATQQNALDVARGIVDRLKANPLRNWEWAHLMYLAAEPSIARHPIEGLPTVEAIAVSPDQKWMAAGAGNAKVYVWSLAAPETPMILDHSAPIASLAFSGDSTILAAASGNEVRLWKLPANSEDAITSTDRPIQYGSRIFSVAFAPADSDIVLTGAAEGGAQLWSRSNPTAPLRALTDFMPGAVRQARFSRDGKQIVTAGDDESVRVWDSSGSNEVRVQEGRTIGRHRGPVYTAEFSHDGKYVISGGRDRQLIAWEVPPPNRAQKREAIVSSLTTGDGPTPPKGYLIGAHDAGIHSISFSPNGKFIYSASDDNSLKVWDISKGFADPQLQKTLRGHGGWVRACAATGDDRHLVSGSHDGQVLVWDWQNYAFPRVLRPASKRPLNEVRFTSIAASPDAKWIATAEENGDVTTWNMSDPLNPQSQILTEGHDWQATTAAYFKGGTRLLTAGGDNSALVWDAKSGNQLVRFGGPTAFGDGTGWRGIAAASHDGRWIATGSDDRKYVAKIWDIESAGPDTGRRPPRFLQIAKSNASTGESQRANEQPDATAIAFAPADKLVFVGDQMGNGYLFDAMAGQLLKLFSAHQGKINAAGFLPNGQLLTASADGTVTAWNIEPATNEPPVPAFTLAHLDHVVAMDISQDGARAVTASDENDEFVLRVWDVATQKEIGRLKRSDLESLVRSQRKSSVDPNRKRKSVIIRSVAFHPTEPHALLTTFDPNIVYDPGKSKSESPHRVATWEWQRAAGTLRFDPVRLGDTSMAVYAPGNDGSILTVGGRGARLRLANQLTMSYRPQTAVQSINFSPDGRVLACAGNDGSVRLWRVAQASGQWMPDQKIVSAHRNSVTSVSFDPRGNDRMLTSGDDGTAKLWERGVNGWKVATTLGSADPSAPINQAIFSAAGDAGTVEVLTASGKGTMKIWSLNGEMLRELPHEGHTSVQCVAVSPDGKWITSGTDSEVWVWNRDGESTVPAQKLTGHSAEITSLTFSPDGMRLFTASRAFNVKVWDTNLWDSDADAVTQRELLTLEGHTDGVMSTAFYASSEHPSLLTAGADGQAILWPSVNWRE